MISTAHSTHTDCIVIGAGAAGLFCAGLLSQKGKSVRIIDHADKVGKKILISGGGRCNFTNLHTKPENFISQNPHFSKSALSGFSPHDFIALVDSYNIAYHEKKLGQLFCDDSAKSIVTMLLSECNRDNTSIELNTKITSVQHSEYFTLHTSSAIFTCDHLIIATGGLSIPKIGASSFGYDIAKQFGHSIIPTYPALVPLLIDNNILDTHSLAGLSIDTIIQSGDSPEFRESMLFTHKGLSGPAILQTSSYYRNTNSIRINTLPALEINTLLKQSNVKSDWKTVLSSFLPNRFAEYWALSHNQKEKSLHYSEKTRLEFLDALQNWDIPIKGDEGYEKAEVTVGGVNTNELSSKTMISKKQDKLYFIGEVVDVTGHLGGFNFQWAWSSAYAAAMSIQ